MSWIGALVSVCDWLYRAIIKRKYNSVGDALRGLLRRENVLILVVLAAMVTVYERWGTETYRYDDALGIHDGCLSYRGKRSAKHIQGCEDAAVYIQYYPLTHALIHTWRTYTTWVYSFLFESWWLYMVGGVVGVLAIWWLVSLCGHGNYQLQQFQYNHGRLLMDQMREQKLADLMRHSPSLARSVGVSPVIEEVAPPPVQRPRAVST